MPSLKHVLRRPSVAIIIILFIGFLAGALGGFAGSALLFSDVSSSLISVLRGKSMGERTIAQINNEQRLAGISTEDQTVTSVQRILPSVVSIVVTKELAQTQNYNQTGPQVFDFGPFQFSMPEPVVPQQPQKKPATTQPQMREVGGGTGFIVSADGLIATNRHVVADEQAHYSVVLNDGTRHDAIVLARDPSFDIAVLKIDATGLSPVTFGNSDVLKVGQSVIAIGNSLGQYRNTVTRGIVSGIGRRVSASGDGIGSEVLESAIQTDAAINPGNSGGPLINLAGEVVGINTAINQQGQLIGFAIPTNEVKRVIESVKKNGRIVRPWLGVRYIILNETIAQDNKLPVKEGALVIHGSQLSEVAVVAGGPADKAGVKENDIIISVDGATVNAEHPLGSMVSKKNPGDTVQLKIQRGTEEKTITVTLGEFPQN